MKKSSWSTATVLAMIFTVSLFGQAMAGERIYHMKGQIAAIETDHHTVVIEVPVGEKMFTVGGPLSSEAILKKSGHSVGLTDFAVGEQVTVRWKATDTGHIIEMLQAR